MTFTIFLATNKAGSEKAIKSICLAAKKSARIYIENVDYKLEASNDGEKIYAIKVSLLDLEDEGTTKQFAEAIAYRIYANGLNKGFLPIDHDGKIIYIFPPYEFAVFLHTMENGKLMLLNDIVNSVCAECPNFHSSWIETPEDAVHEGELFIVHITLQDYYSPEMRYLVRLACFLRLMVKVTSAGFTAIEFPEEEEEEPQTTNNS